MRKLVVASLLTTLLTPLASATWAFVSVTADLSLEDVQGNATKAAGTIGGHSDWWQVFLELGRTVSANGYCSEPAYVYGTVHFTYRWTSGGTPPATISAQFEKYRRHYLYNWIYGADPAQSGYATYTSSTVYDYDTGSWYDPYLENILTGQTTYNQATHNYISYPYGETYPYLSTWAQSGISTYYSSPDGEYRVTVDIPLSGRYSTDYGMAVDVTLAAGNSSALAQGYALCGLALEPKTVGDTNFSTGSPMGGNGD